ncbi:hypothetical protein ACN4EK_09445 [Pantanalinema rosaneae CENA516]
MSQDPAISEDICGYQWQNLGWTIVMPLHLRSLEIFDWRITHVCLNRTTN